MMVPEKLKNKRKTFFYLQELKFYTKSIHEKFKFTWYLYSNEIQKVNMKYLPFFHINFDVVGLLTSP